MLIGGGGRDVLIGGGGPDSLHGDGGHDSFNMRDGEPGSRPGGATGSTPATVTPTRSTAAQGRDLAVVDEVEDGHLRLRGGQRAVIRRPPTTRRGSRGASSPTPSRSSGSRPTIRDELLRRREFLGRTAALAGLAGMAGVLPAETLVAEAAKRAARKPLPKPRDLPIDTFVVLMMENRSFDHYFGWHRRADGRNAGLCYPNLDGSQTFATHRLTPDFQGCDFRDPDHGWNGGRHQIQLRQARRLLHRQPARAPGRTSSRSATT